MVQRSLLHSYEVLRKTQTKLKQSDRTVVSPAEFWPCFQIIHTDLRRQWKPEEDDSGVRTQLHPGLHRRSQGRLPLLDQRQGTDCREVSPLIHLSAVRDEDAVLSSNTRSSPNALTADNFKGRSMGSHLMLAVSVIWCTTGSGNTGNEQCLCTVSVTGFMVHCLFPDATTSKTFVQKIMNEI